MIRETRVAHPGVERADCHPLLAYISCRKLCSSNLMGNEELHIDDAQGFRDYTYQGTYLRVVSYFRTPDIAWYRIQGLRRCSTRLGSRWIRLTELLGSASACIVGEVKL